jgi:hypothetical protein
LCERVWRHNTVLSVPKRRRSHCFYIFDGFVDGLSGKQKYFFRYWKNGLQFLAV